MNLWLPKFRDCREPRDWLRPWRDWPGLICCCTSDTPMYACGGTTGTSTLNTADKIMMTAETGSAVTTANLSQARDGPAAAGNPAIAGYFAGGETPSGTYVVTADKLVISSDTTSAKTTANLSQARLGPGGISERSSKAYFGGGASLASPATYVVTTDVLTFSGDSTAAQTTANLSQARDFALGITEGTSKGYWLGGNTTGGVVTADKITFSGDSTAAQTSANLSAKRLQLEGGSDGSTKGYACGGRSLPSAFDAVTTVDKITFSTDTTAALTTASFQRYGGASGSNGTKMIGAGGVKTGGGIVADGNKMTFATDAAASVGTLLSVSREFLAGFSYQAL